MPLRRFKATLERSDTPGSWTYVTIPFDVEKIFGHKRQVKIKGKINGHTYCSSAMPRGDGSHFLVVSNAIRTQINVKAGDRVAVVMDLDTDPRVVEVPDDFLEALAMHKQAKVNFEKFSYSRQKEYVTWMTRQRQAKPECIAFDPESSVLHGE